MSRPIQCANHECKSEDVYERYSLGIYAGRYCDPHWDASGYRKEGREGFDPADAGECYEADDY
jgi:hypothetical protein